jgi:hypothetical protein
LAGLTSLTFLAPPPPENLSMVMTTIFLNLVQGLLQYTVETLFTKTLAYKVKQSAVQVLNN